KEISDNVYFKNVNNNAGVFDAIIGAAEEQECKEAFLAYYFLATTTEPLTQSALDEHIERWLQDTFGVDVDFEVDDALAKLERLHVVGRQAHLAQRLDLAHWEVRIVRAEGDLRGRHEFHQCRHRGRAGGVRGVVVQPAEFGRDALLGESALVAARAPPVEGLD